MTTFSDIKDIYKYALSLHDRFKAMQANEPAGLLENVIEACWQDTNEAQLHYKKVFNQLLQRYGGLLPKDISDDLRAALAALNEIINSTVQIKQDFGQQAVQEANRQQTDKGEDPKLMAYLLGEERLGVVLDVVSNKRRQADQELTDLADAVHVIDITDIDKNELQFPNEKFDMVCARFAAHHFMDIERALAEMTRVLRPGGKLYILDRSVIDGNLFEDVINHIEALRDNSHRCSYSPRAWRSLLGSLPLEIQQLDLIPAEYRLPDWFDQLNTPQTKREEVFLYLDSLPPTLKRYYPYGEDFITTYRIEVLAVKKTSE